MRRGKRSKAPRRLGGLRRTLHNAGLLERTRPLRSLARLAQTLPTRGNDVKLFHSGDDLFEAMLADISAARTRISMEMYMFSHDSVGREFARALAERAAAGVKVRLVYDAVGSFATSTTFLASMRDTGIELLEYHPVKPWRKRFTIWRRNHRKTLVVDGAIAYTGGTNIGLQWRGLERGGENWRDTQARVQGPAAGDLEILFAETWFRQSGELLRLPRAQPREAPEGTDPGGAEVFVVSGLGGPKRHIRSLYMLALREAREHIQLTVSYFMPDGGFRRALARAAARGVRVRLLLPEHSDLPWTMWVARAFYEGMLRRGVEIYHWQPNVLHAKTAVIDHSWSMVGSSNLDHFSLNLNLEANLVIHDQRICDELSAQFERDLAQSRRIQLDEWLRRPWRDRLREGITWFLRPWL